MLTIFRKRRVSQIISWIVLCTFLNLINGCGFYYKVNKTKAPPESSIIKYQNDKKFIILHKGLSAWHFTNIVVGQDSVHGTISKLVGHQWYKTTDPIGTNRYQADDRSEILNEVHIYTLDFRMQADSTAVSVPSNAIREIDIYDPASGMTAASWILPPIGAIALVLIIVAMTKSSCPFIYTTDGTSSEFVGEIYSGAIYPSLERDDYLILPEKRYGQEEYNIRMTNEVHEIQNTNLIELNVFDHPKGINVYIDKYGNYQTTGKKQQPITATNLTGENILDLVRNEDTLSYVSSEPGKDMQIKDGIIMNFKRPTNALSAKIVVKAKTTFWLDYVFTRFHELFGKEYDCWVDKQTKVPPQKMKNWMIDQSIPLSLFVEKNGHWQFVDYYNIVGPMAAKEDILSFDISDIPSDIIKVKLEYGTLFWDIDYAAVDYTENVHINHRIAEFESALDNNDKDVKNLLAASDLLYYVQPEVGDAVNMKFKIPEKTDAVQTLIMHSKGHYKILLNMAGNQHKRELLTFRKKGHFPQFSNSIIQNYPVDTQQ